MSKLETLAEIEVLIKSAPQGATMPPSNQASRISPPPAPIATIKPVVVKMPVPIMLEMTMEEAGVSVSNRRVDSERVGWLADGVRSIIRRILSHCALELKDATA